MALPACVGSLRNFTSLLTMAHKVKAAKRQTLLTEIINAKLAAKKARSRSSSPTTIAISTLPR